MLEDRSKRSRSRSKSREHRHKRRKDDKYNKLQDQITNLTKVVESLAKVQKEQPQQQQTANKADAVDNISIIEQDDKENNAALGNNPTTQKEAIPQEKPDGERDNVLKALDVDVNEPKFKEVKYHPELKNTWGKWIKEGLPDKNKTEILELYNRQGELYTEAPKVNLEIRRINLSQHAKFNGIDFFYIAERRRVTYFDYYQRPRIIDAKIPM